MIVCNTVITWGKLGDVDGIIMTEVWLMIKIRVLVYWRNQLVGLLDGLSYYKDMSYDMGEAGGGVALYHLPTARTTETICQSRQSPSSGVASLQLQCTPDYTTTISLLTANN